MLKLFSVLKHTNFTGQWSVRLHLSDLMWLLNPIVCHLSWILNVSSAGSQLKINFFPIELSCCPVVLHLQFASHANILYQYHMPRSHTVSRAFILSSLKHHCHHFRMPIVKSFNLLTLPSLILNHLTSFHTNMNFHSYVEWCKHGSRLPRQPLKYISWWVMLYVSVNNSANKLFYVVVYWRCWQNNLRK